MNIDALRATLSASPGTRLIEASGDLFAIYDPDHDYEQRPRQGWATVITSNSDRSASILDSPGVYRLNIGLPRDRFREVVDSTVDHDPAAMDVVLPHPIYGELHWVCVVNPDQTWPAVRKLLADAHAFAARQHSNAERRRTSRTEASAEQPIKGSAASGRPEVDTGCPVSNTDAVGQPRSLWTSVLAVPSNLSLLDDFRRPCAIRLSGPSGACAE